MTKEISNNNSVHAGPGRARSSDGVAIALEITGDGDNAERGMVGRMAELSALQSAFFTALEKRELQMVTVIGEPGIGKSRLLREFQRWLQTFSHQTNLLYGRAEAETTAQPFSLVRSLVRLRLGIQSSDSADVARDKFEQGFAGVAEGRELFSRVQIDKIARLLGFDFSAPGQTPDLLQEGQQARYQIFESLSNFFAAPGNRQNPKDPAHQVTLLLLDDIQWSDEDSIDFIMHLAKNHQATPIMILTLARPLLLERRPTWGEGLNRHAQLALEPLSPRESEILVETLMSPTMPLPAAVREMILADAGGHPFYIEEIIKVFLEKKVILPGADSWTFDAKRLVQTPVSTTLGGVLRARLDNLSVSERRVIQCASVVGGIFWESAVESLCQTPPETISKQALQEILVSLCHKDLIHRRESSGFSGTNEYIIKHELLRDVVFATLPKKLRSEHHARAAAWFVEHGRDRIREFSGLVAVHLEHAGQGASAAEWYGQAGEQAWNSFAPGAAIDYFQKAIGLFRSTPEGRGKEGRLNWHEGISLALTAAGRFTDALASYNQVSVMAKTTNDIAAEARAWGGIAYLHERGAEYRASIEAAERAASLARQAGDNCSDELIRSLYLKGWALYRLSDAPGVLTLATQTLELCERFGKRNWLASCYKLYGVAHLQLGHYSEAERYFNQGLALCLELGDRRNAGSMFSNLGESARLKGDFQSAVSLYQKALEIAREIGNRPGEMLYLSNLGGARLGLEQFSEAEKDLRQAIAMTGMRKFCSLSETYTFLAQACLGQGKLTEGRDAAQQGISIAMQIGNPLDLAGGWRAAGRILAAWSQTGEAGKPSISIGDSHLNYDINYCFSESIRLYETIGAADEQARTSHIWAACRQQS